MDAVKLSVLPLRRATYFSSVRLASLSIKQEQREGNWGMERLSNLLKVSGQVCGRVSLEPKWSSCKAHPFDLTLLILCSLKTRVIILQMLSGFHFRIRHLGSIY